MGDGLELSLVLIMDPRLCAVLKTLAGAELFPWTGAKPGFAVEIMSWEWASAGARYDLNDTFRAGGGTGAGTARAGTWGWRWDDTEAAVDGRT